MSADVILGIDLGTTHSLVGVVDSGFPFIIPGPDGRKLLPSAVSFDENGEVAAVGIEALRARLVHPARTVTSVKRFMGRRLDSLTTAEAEVPYPLEADGQGRVVVRQGSRVWSPPEISALILLRLKERAEAYLGHGAHRAVITVPAYFNDAQRQATREAGERAGLRIERILNEPTAAALAYGLDRRRRKGCVAVFDFGGGTFDLSLLQLTDGVFQVLATHGDTRLGGDDIDRTLAAWLEDGLTRQGVACADVLSRTRLLAGAEEVKIRLSRELETSAEFPFLDLSAGASFGVSRDLLEQMAAPFLERIRAHCLRCLQDAKLAPAQIDEVVLVGGQTRMPCVRELVAALFGREPDVSADPDEAVAMGAVLQAGILSGSLQELVLLDVTPLSLGLESFGGLMNVLIPRNSSIPVKAGELFTNAVDGQSLMHIHVLQGERELAKDNFSLGSLELPFEPAPRGRARVGVQFEIDADGILHVLTRDVTTGVERRLELQSAVDVSDDTVEKMVAESVEHAFEDMTERQLIETRLKAQRLAKAARSALDALGQEVEPSLRQDVLRGAEQLESILGTATLSEIKAAISALDRLTQGLAGQLMEKTLQQRLER
ncbi:MAG: Hsp70 family protein [Candidatus Methylacidiphilales bacterium]|nr:Hsp70 family protein [Candidatus Methylacidiphilales bacterium]